MIWTPEVEVLSNIWQHQPERSEEETITSPNHPQGAAWGFSLLLRLRSLWTVLWVKDEVVANDNPNVCLQRKNCLNTGAGWTQPVVSSGREYTICRDGFHRQLAARWKRDTICLRGGWPPKWPVLILLCMRIAVLLQPYGSTARGKHQIIANVWWLSGIFRLGCIDERIGTELQDQMKCWSGLVADELRLRVHSSVLKRTVQAIIKHDKGARAIEWEYLSHLLPTEQYYPHWSIQDNLKIVLRCESYHLNYKRYRPSNW